MKFIELVKKRQSVRKYRSAPVEKEKILNCLEAARLAPSASNGQPWTFVVVDQAEVLKKISGEIKGPLGTFNRFAEEVPVVIVIVIEKMKTVTEIGHHLKDREFSLIDIGIAAEHFCLQAAEEGLGTCMVGWFNENPIKEALGIPEKKRIGLLITLGYPREGYQQRNKIRKSMEEIMRWNRYPK